MTYILRYDFESKIEEESVRGKVSESAGKTFYSTIPSPKWPICPQLYMENPFFRKFARCLRAIYIVKISEESVIGSV